MVEHGEDGAARLVQRRHDGPRVFGQREQREHHVLRIHARMSHWVKVAVSVVRQSSADQATQPVR